MPIMLGARDRELWVAAAAPALGFEGCVCSAPIVQPVLGAGEPRSSLRGCSETALKLIPAHL